MTISHTPAIGLGLAALGRPAYINIGHGHDFQGENSISMMQQRTHRLLNYAFEHGIRHIDTARSYGLAESFLASWLAENSTHAQALTISSKWGYTYTANWQADASVHEIKEHSIDNLNKQWAESQHLLGKHLDMYLVHSATLDSGILDNRDVLKRLYSLKQQSIRIGISTSGPEQATTIERALALTIAGEPLFDVVQVTYNLFDTSVAAQLQIAHDNGVFVIIKEALANGRLSTTASKSAPIHTDKLAPIQQRAAHYQTTMDVIALAAILQQPFVNIVLSGAATLHQLQSNIAAQTLMPQESLFDTLAEMVQQPQDYWATRSMLRWN